MKSRYPFGALTRALFLLVILVLLSNALTLNPAGFEVVNEYATSDVVYADGRTASFDDKNFGRLDKNDTATIHLRLPEQPFFKNSTLIFYDYSAVTEVWFGDMLLDSYGADIEAKKLMIGNRYFQIPVPDEAWGSEIAIKVRATSDNSFSNFTNIRVYPSEHAHKYYINVDPFGYFGAIVLFAFAVLGVFACILGGINGKALVNALCLTSTMLLVSFWLTSNEGLYNVLGLEAYFWQPLEYIAGYTLAIPLLLFYRGMTDEKSRWYKIFGVAAAAVSVFFIVATVLNFATDIHYDSLMGVAGVLLITSALLLLIYTMSMKADARRPQLILKTGMYIFLLTCLHEAGIRLLFRLAPLASTFNYTSLIAAGAILFALCHICAFIANLHDGQNELIAAQLKAENLSTTLESIPTGLCRLKPDDDLTLVAANKAFYTVIGYREEQLSDDSPKSIFANLYEDEKVFVREKVKQLLASPDNSGEFEFDTVDIDDKPLSVLIKYYIDRYGSGDITVNIIDITDRKRMEEKLRVVSEDYRTAIEASDHLYFSYDPATRTIDHMFDSDKLFGISEKLTNIPESLIELGLFAPESVEDARNAFDMYNKGEKGGDFCLHMQNIKTHELRWYAGSFRTILDASGKPLHAIVAFKDVTEQREKEIAFNMHRQQIEAHNEDEIAYYEVNLTTGICEYHYGADAKHLVDLSKAQWDEMVVHALELFVRSEDRKAMNDMLSRSHLLEKFERGVTEFSNEFKGIGSHGQSRWSRISMTLTSDSQTREVRAFCTVEDIDKEKTEQLERLEQKRRSQYYEDAYSRLSSSVMYGVCKYTADDDLTIVFANDIFYQMHGFDSQEQAKAAGFTNVLYAIPPFGKDLVLSAHQKYIESNSEQVFETEYPTVDVNGNPIWILCRGVYSPTEKMFNSSVLDITDRKNTEEELRVSEERYKLALQQSGNVFFFFDVPSRTMRLSEQLAQAFGLPLEVDNMPDNFISQGLVEPESVEVYRDFYRRIISGEESGDAIIACHMRGFEDTVLWYRIAFSSLFDRNKNPVSAIITYEDLSQQYKTQLAASWKQLNLMNIPEESYVITEYDLTRGVLLSEVGGLFDKMPEMMKNYEEINALVLSTFIYGEDKAAYAAFLDRNRLLDAFGIGNVDDSIEYRSMQSGSRFRWTRTAVQMISDPFSGHTMGQFLIQDIHNEKIGQIQLKKSMEELKKELENSRIKIMINQMQPHFLYNALSAIRTITKRDPDYAYDLLYDFTTHLRGSIKALSSDDLIPFSDELKNVRAYLNIERMRFGNSLKVVYDIECDDFMVAPLTVQPLAENASRHGVYPKGEDGGTITIRSSEDESCYIVEVEDDGVGFDVEEVLHSDNDSVGLKSLIFRLKSLMNADVTVVSRIGEGTKATIQIPKSEQKTEKD